MDWLLQQIQIHHEAIGVFLFFAFMSWASTMPKQWAGWGTLWAWFYDFWHELFSLLSQKYSTQLQAAEGVVPPSPTPMQLQPQPVPPKPAVTEIKE